MLLQQEVLLFKDLPPTSYDVEEYHYGKIRKDGHVRFRNKYYSVEEKFHGKEVFIVGNSKRVEIYYQCKLIETHPRITGSFQSKSTKDHHLKPWEQVARDSKHYIEKAESFGPSVKTFISKILMHGRGFVDTRKVWGVLSLDKDYQKSEIDRACKYALEIESLSYQTVVSFLKLTPRTSIKLDKSNSNKFVRSPDEYLKFLQ